MGGEGARRAFMAMAGLVLLALVAVVAFGAGAAHGGPPDGAYAHWGHAGFGWFLFPFLFFPLGFFLFFGLLRFLFWGAGGYGAGHHWHEERERRLEDWHRRAHEREQTPGGDRPDQT